LRVREAADGPSDVSFIKFDLVRDQKPDELIAKRTPYQSAKRAAA
jgi:hypothetical protein